MPRVGAWGMRHGVRALTALHCRRGLDRKCAVLVHGFPKRRGHPLAGLIADSQGNLYGTTSAGGANKYGTVFELTPAGVETVLYNFCFTPNCNNGVFPQAGLIADSQGNLYGTTLEGGVSGYGTVFELSPPAVTGGAWSITVLHAFTEQGSDGSYPLAGLIADTSGNLYGTTTNGGSAAGYGTVFELSNGAAHFHGRERRVHAPRRPDRRYGGQSLWDDP